MQNAITFYREMKQVLNANNCNNFSLKGDVTLPNVTTKFFNYLKKEF